MMLPITRRRFLQLTGLTLIGGTLRSLKILPIFDSPSLAEPVPQMARTLYPLPVYEAPQVDAQLMTYLWPDSMVEVLGETRDWYAIPDGFVAHAGLQLMKPYFPTTSTQLPDCPFQAEVAAPVAPVRAWCAADAPLVSRMDHGITARIIDGLPHENNSGVWYAVEGENGTILGWSQAVFWRLI
jgi:hypothetical protein